MKIGNMKKNKTPDTDFYISLMKNITEKEVWMQIIFIILFLILTTGCISNDHFYKEKPITIMRKIYSCDDPEQLLNIFTKSHEFAKNNQTKFLEAINWLNRSNDLMNLLELNKIEKLTSDQENLICARILARVVFSMGEIENCEKQFSRLLSKILEFPDNYDINKYLLKPAYTTMAKTSPEKLKGCHAGKILEI